MNYRLIYYPVIPGAGPSTYGAETTITAADIIDIDISPTETNADDLFRIAGRKAKVRIIYHNQIKTHFTDEFQTHPDYPDYMNFVYRVESAKTTNYSPVFYGTLNISTLKIDEDALTVEFYLSDNLDTFINIAKSIQREIVAGVNDKIIINDIYGDYPTQTLIYLIQQPLLKWGIHIYVIGQNVPLDSPLLPTVYGFPFNILTVPSTEQGTYNNDFSRWEYFGTGALPQLNTDCIYVHRNVDTQEYWISMIKVWRGLFLTQSGSYYRYAIRSYSFKVSYALNSGLFTYVPGSIKIEESDNHDLQRIHEKIRVRTYYPNLSDWNSFDPPTEGEVFPLDNVYTSPLDNDGEQTTPRIYFDLSNDQWLVNAVLDIDPITIKQGSYALSTLIRTVFIANRLTAYNTISLSGWNRILITRTFLPIDSDTIPEVLLGSDMITALNISGIYTDGRYFDEITNSVVSFENIISALYTVYQQIIGSFKKSISFDIMQSDVSANSISLLTKIGIDGKTYLVTSISEPDDFGITTIKAVGKA